MKRLSKAQEQTRSELLERLRKAQSEMAAEVDKANEAVGAVNAAIDSYNEALSDVETFRDEITGDMESYADERSDKWRDSDAGSNYDSWKSEWDNLDTSEVAHAEEIEEPDLSHADDLEALPSEVEG